MSTDPATKNASTRDSGAAPRAKRGRATAGAVALAAVAFVAGGLFVSNTDARVRGELMQSSGIQQIQAAAPARVVPAVPPRIPLQGNTPFSFADLVQSVSPAVVTVITDRQEQANALPDGLPEAFRDFFRQYGGQGRGGNEPPQTRRARAMGSGFIIEPNGYIVTNHHVVADATKISVRLPDDREFQAKVVGSDSETDVALLKVDGVNNLPVLAFGDDSRLRVGDWVVAVGNPFGLAGTVTAGIVSSLGRDIGQNSTFTDYIQIDAPINQGNSGGPTLDLTGRVVGVNSAIFSPTGGSVGIGFAIPASTVQGVIQQLKTSGAVARGWLGVSIQNLTPDMASSIGVPDAKGAIVAQVVENSPAQRAGFQQGDVVLAINGTNVTDSRDLTRRVAAVRAGDRANFTIVRDGMRRQITATIDKRDLEQLAGMREQTRPGAPVNPQLRQNSTTSLGMSLVPLTAAGRQQYRLEDEVNGVLVTEVDPNSEAAEKGFAAGDVIVSVSNRQVRTPADITRAVADARAAGRDSVLLLVADSQAGERFVALKVAG